MAKLSRKQRLKRQARVPTPTTPRAMPTTVKEYRQVICPVCGRSQGSLAFWERLRTFDPNKPFGVVQDVGRGRGASFTVLGNFGPEGAPEIFSLIKARFVAAVGEWTSKGWLSKEDLEGVTRDDR